MARSRWRSSSIRIGTRSCALYGSAARSFGHSTLCVEKYCGTRFQSIDRWVSKQGKEQGG